VSNTNNLCSDAGIVASNLSPTTRTSTSTRLSDARALAELPEVQVQLIDTWTQVHAHCVQAPVQIQAHFSIFKYVKCQHEPCSLKYGCPTYICEAANPKVLSSYSNCDSALMSLKVIMYKSR